MNPAACCLSPGAISTNSGNGSMFSARSVLAASEAPRWLRANVRRLHVGGRPCRGQTAA